MELKEYSKYVFVILFALILYLSYKVIENYITTLVVSIILGILFYPLFRWMKKKVKNKHAASLLTVVVILIIAVIPFLFVLQALIVEALDAIDYIRTEFSDDGRLTFACQDRDNAICQQYMKLKEIYPELEMSSYVVSAGRGLVNIARRTINTLTSGIFRFFISLYIVYFLFVDGKKLLKIIKETLSFRPEQEKKITNTLKDTTYGVVFGSLVVALIQGAIAAFGYWLIGGYNSALLLGLLTAFFALIPGIGTTLVWIPASLYLIAMGWLMSDSTFFLRGAGLFIYGALIVSTIDNVIKPMIIGDRAKIHPVIVMLGVLGGVSMTGSFVGVMIGPLVLALCVSFVDMLRIERRRL